MPPDAAAAFKNRLRTGAGSVRAGRATQAKESFPGIGAGSGEKGVSAGRPLFSETSPFCFRSVFDEITNEWSVGFVIAAKRPRAMSLRRWHIFTSAFFFPQRVESSDRRIP